MTSGSHGNHQCSQSQHLPHRAVIKLAPPQGQAWGEGAAFPPEAPLGYSQGAQGQNIPETWQLKASGMCVTCLLPQTPPVSSFQSLGEGPTVPRGSWEEDGDENERGDINKLSQKSQGQIFYISPNVTILGPGVWGTLLSHRRSTLLRAYYALVFLINPIITLWLEWLHCYAVFVLKAVC